MQEQKRPNSAGNDFSIGDDSEIDSKSNQVSQYNLSYDGEEESASEEGDKLYHLSKEQKDMVKMKIETDRIRCLRDDILKALKNYRKARKKRGKQLSTRRVADIKRLHVIARNYNNYETREDFIVALTQSVEAIRGGKLIFNRNKSSLKDALNEIIHAYSSPASYEEQGRYKTTCHYIKIQHSLQKLAQERLPKRGVEDTLRPGTMEIVTGLSKSEERDAAYEALKVRNAELEEDIKMLRQRLQIIKSGGASGGDSKNSRGKTPPANLDGKSESPHSVEDGSSPRKDNSLKKMPPAPAGVFGMSINDDSLEDLTPSTKIKKGAESSRLSIEEEERKTKRAGKK